MTQRIKAGWPRRGLWLGGAMALGLVASTPAWAQFSLFGSREASPEDVSDTIAEHGFRLMGPLYRNGRVYLADVLDRRQRRERLVISAESGEIVQRFFVDVGPERQAPMPRAAPRDESFFSHLTRGWDDSPPPRPPAGLSGSDDMPPVTPLAPRPVRPQPRVVTRTETGPVPVTASPLPPPNATPSAPATASNGNPEVVAVPSRRPDAASVVAVPPSSVRATSVATDPLRIPGARKPEEAKAAPVTTAVKTVDPAPTTAAAPPTTKPKPADVPVAPLD
ncbi:hypothetical protein [Lichenihabitans sp. Uapishka_5]|uniref:hypothetical protein n=1 Tax=Lichenihabitans sp. Uapishka_5 TaxID=3037302 RepID=UPI0029E7F81F|nr:hypothetical protein [Lichenihabitans sp. Uapishka_5]